MLLKRLQNNGSALLRLNTIQKQAKKEVENKIQTGKYTFEEICCPICSNKDAFHISKKGKFNLPTYVVLCKQCGLAYLNPRWDSNSYLEFYKKEYDKYYRINEIENNIFKPDLKILKRINKMLPIHISNILDVGSGKGDNLIFFKNNFKDVNLFAIETSTKCQEKLKQHNISLICNNIDGLCENNYLHKFDIIIMRHVLEHFMNPIDVLKKIHKTISNHGILYIAVPDNLHPTQNLRNSWFRNVHTFYFNKHSLQNVLGMTGFKVLAIKEENGELYAIAKKGIYNKPKIDKNYFIKQKDIFMTLLKKEKSIAYFLKNIKFTIYLILQKLHLKP